MKSLYRFKFIHNKRKKSLQNSETELNKITIEIYNWIRRDKVSSKSNSFDIQKVTKIGVAFIKVIEFLIKIFGGTFGK